MLYYGNLKREVQKIRRYISITKIGIGGDQQWYVFYPSRAHDLLYSGRKSRKLYDYKSARAYASATAARMALLRLGESLAATCVSYEPGDGEGVERARKALNKVTRLGLANQQTLQF